jgi:hypothetical protein
MGGTCNISERNKKCMKHFTRKVRRKEPFGRLISRWVDEDKRILEKLSNRMGT